jgi:hypothetical protein
MSTIVPLPPSKHTDTHTDVSRRHFLSFAIFPHHRHSSTFTMVKNLTRLVALLALSQVDAFVSRIISQAAISSLSASNYEHALLFDCDGVILETEEFHRIAYNKAFEEFSLTIDGEAVVWSVPYYDILQNTVGGGKPKMFYHFRETAKAFPMAGDKPAPATLEEQQALIDELQEFKTNTFKTLVESLAKARPGVLVSRLLSFTLHVHV